MNPFKNDGDMVLKPIPQQAHEDGWNSTLNNLAAFLTRTKDENV